MNQNKTKILQRKILSGMRPTGPLHLGHLFGALFNWVSLQDEYKCYYMVADWHALLSEYENPGSIKGYTRVCVADWLAVGLDPEKSAIFVQSEVKEHAELHMILSTITPLPWLERCPTYKEQLREIKGRDLFTYGFLGYPVLQAADILLYQADAVPVGRDQVPHLELTREIARRFNKLYKKVFPEPQPLLTESAKLLGLDNRKMSKSYGNFIALADPPEEIREKVRGMITDTRRIRLSDPGHPEDCNVFAYHRLFNNDQLPEVEDWCRNAKQGCTDCKKCLAEVLIKYLEPMREKREYWLKGDRIEEVLEDGASRARAAAAATLEEVHEVMGF
ncbi:MAG TPA: tryptophan--tRNA ligase, partial [Proteobacteria bacterium]|nr:tryptophan--tRNA ligase [Pseudomonadota bacterium]